MAVRPRRNVLLDACFAFQSFEATAFSVEAFFIPKIPFRTFRMGFKSPARTDCLG
jgi:hypothetical protein